MFNRETLQFAIYVNEEKGITSVRILNGVDQLAAEFDMFCKKNEIDFDYRYFRSFVTKYGKQIDKLIGFSTCNTEAGDNFDAEFGVELAKERVLTYFEGFRTKFYTGFCLKMDSIAEMASIRAEMSDNRRYDRIEQVNTLIDELKK